MQASRHSPQMHWIKADSGETYICPATLPQGSSEEELKKQCVAESDNPQNN